VWSCLSNFALSQVLAMQSCDVDGNEWMDSFDGWRGEVVKSLLVTFFVQPPAGFSAAGAQKWVGSCQFACMREFLAACKQDGAFYAAPRPCMSAFVLSHVYVQHGPIAMHSR
jgi:hypothetical protein